MSYRPNKDWDKETLDEYLILSGWKPANMTGALSLVGYVADAMLEGLIEHNLLDRVDVRGMKSKVVFIPDEEEVKDGRETHVPNKH